jgi:hypothetical protein
MATTDETGQVTAGASGGLRRAPSGKIGDDG